MKVRVTGWDRRLKVQMALGVCGWDTWSSSFPWEKPGMEEGDGDARIHLKTRWPSCSPRLMKSLLRLASLTCQGNVESLGSHSEELRLRAVASAFLCLHFPNQEASFQSQGSPRPPVGCPLTPPCQSRRPLAVLVRTSNSMVSGASGRLWGRGMYGGGTGSSGSGEA